VPTIRAFDAAQSGRSENENPMRTLDDLPWIELGHGVTACQYRYRLGGQLHIAYRHLCSHEPGGAMFLAFAAVPVSAEGAGRDWKLESLEPLTISPSLLCMSCQHHGWIREGRWIPA
jgi:hypothetical protein